MGNGGWKVLAVLAAAQFLMVLDQAVMNVSISQLVEDFDTEVTTIQSVITFYALFTVSDYSLERFDSEYLYVTTFPVALSVLRYLQTLVAGKHLQRRYSLKGCTLWRPSQFGSKHSLVPSQRRPT